MRSNEEIVSLIDDLRRQQDLSISELARRVDMAKSAISRYFNKTREFPLNKVEVFANVLGVSSEYILGFDEEDNKYYDSVLSSITSENKTLKEIIKKLGDLNEEELQMVNSTIDSLLRLKEKRD